MILKQCYIENFGKHSSFKYDFSDGFNPLIEHNGWGKSTLAIFIKAMFYGLPVSRKTNFEENDRKKYTPWQGGNYGGYIEFEVDNREYRLERYFGKKESDDTFTLIDLKTNKKSLDFDENIGITLFGLDADAYERSTFIPQKILSGNINESLSSKLTNVIQGTDNVDGYEQAIEKINEKKRDLKNNQNRGTIPDTQAKIYNLTQEINAIKQNESVVKELEINLDRENAIIDTLQKESELLRSKIKSNAELQASLIKLDQLEELQAKAGQCENRIAELYKFTNGRQILESDLQRIANLSTDLAIEKNTEKGLAEKSYLDDRYQKLNNYFHANVPTSEEMNDWISKCARLDQSHVQKKNKLINLPIAGLGLIMAILGAVAISFSILAGILLFLVAGVTILSSFIIGKNRDKGNSVSNQEQEIIEFVSRYEKITGSLDFHLHNINKLANDYRECKQEIETVVSKIRSVKARINEIEGVIQNYFSEFNLDPTPNCDEKIVMLRKIVMEREVKERELREIKEKLNSINPDLKNLKVDKSENISSLQAREKEVNIELDLHKELRLKYINQINKYRDQICRLADLENELGLYNQELVDANIEMKRLKLVADFMEQAKDELASKYLSPMKNAFNKYMNLLLNEEAEYLIDTDLNVSVVSKGKAREVDYLSRGYQSIVDLCVRFALIDTIFTKEKPFIILDDPFINLDEEKTANALALIKNVAKDYQIIYMACHKARA